MKRTIRLIKKYNTNDFKITMVARNNIFNFDKSINFVLLDEATEKSTVERTQIELKEYWCDTNIFLFGDNWYSDDAMKTISNYNADDIHFFGRPYPSKITGKKWGELFALYIPKSSFEILNESVNKLENMKIKQEIKRVSSWELYDILHGNKISDVLGVFTTSGNWTIIDDFTDDFDIPDDVITWMELYNKHNKQG